MYPQSRRSSRRDFNRRRGQQHLINRLSESSMSGGEGISAFTAVEVNSRDLWHEWLNYGIRVEMFESPTIY